MKAAMAFTGMCILLGTALMMVPFYVAKKVVTGHV